MILLKKNGKIFYSREYERKKISVPSFLPFMNEPLEIEEGATFKTFFNHIMREKEKYSEFFASHLGHYDLKVFDEEWQKPYVKEKDDGMEFLEIYWHVDYDREDNIINEQPALHGRGYAAKDGVTAYAIDFTPLNKLKKYPLKLNTEYIIEEYMRRKPRSRKIFAGKKSFTVYDVIDAVLYEITFYGGPQQRNEQLEELKRRVDEVERGEAKLIPMEEMFAELKGRAKSENHSER